ncbi:tripartite tricarboxylate transporter TctB family protein [Halovulum sp. GXIMD14794]
MKADRLFLGLLVVLGGIALIASSFAYPSLPGQAYGAGTMPRVVGGFGILLGAALLLQGWRQGADRQRFARADWARGRQGLAVLAVLLGVVVYIVAAEPIGFIPVAGTLLLALMLLGKVRLLPALVVSVIASVAVYVVFSRFLLVPLPRGPLEALLW